MNERRDGNMAYGFIYITTNHTNGKKYIGKRVYDEDGKWKKYLGSGVNLKRAINKYGVDNFSKMIIDEALSKDELNEKERYWISYYNAVRDPLFYNISSGGDGGVVTSGYSNEEMLEYQRRQKEIRARWSDFIPVGEDSASSKLSNDEVKEIISRLMNCDYSSDIAYDYQVAPSTIDDIRYHRTWKHLTKDISFPDAPKKRTGLNKKSVDVFDLRMNYIRTYESSRAIERDLGVSYKLVSAVCNGEKHTSHGYIFRFAQ